MESVCVLAFMFSDEREARQWLIHDEDTGEQDVATFASIWRLARLIGDQATEATAVYLAGEIKKRATKMRSDKLLLL